MAAFVPFKLKFEILGGGFEEGEDLLAFVRTRIDGTQVLLTLHFPDRGYRTVFLYCLIMDLVVGRLLGSLSRFHCFF